ncbi:MAG TPA: hypothetical protein PKM25_16195 [Candidatus Ozemobacteraceae bacterium]|nr:hypothetical protein [Candidatus Ozemobacteraceae bacterium]
MMRKWPCTFFLLALAAGLHLSAAPAVWGQQVKFIDIRLMLLAHPLFRQFSADTGRFADTSSEPVFDGEEGIRRVEAELAVVKQKYAALPATWANRFAAKLSGAERKSVEEGFMSEQRSLQDRAKMLEDRLIQLRGVHGRPGLTSNMSMAGQAKTIADDIRKAVVALRSNFGGVIMDISQLMPDAAPNPDTKVVFSNQHFQLWRAPFNPGQATLEWLDNVKLFLSTSHQPFLPVVYGGTDGRAEAVRLIEQTTGGK